MVRPPLLLRFLYPGVKWHFPRKDKVLYLTFDDGPVPEVTPHVLELLDQYNAKATFFCIGDNVRKHPDVYASLLAKGHTIGNHTYHHYNSWKVSTKTFLDDTAAAKQYINSTLFRPPYGKLTPGTLFGLRNAYKIIMWDVISCDFDSTVPKETVYNNVIQFAKEGSIVVFHDSLKASENMLYALPKVLEHFSKLEFRFEKIEG